LGQGKLPKRTHPIRCHAVKKTSSAQQRSPPPTKCTTKTVRVPDIVQGALQSMDNMPFYDK